MAILCCQSDCKVRNARPALQRPPRPVRTAESRSARSAHSVAEQSEGVLVQQPISATTSEVRSHSTLLPLS